MEAHANPPDHHDLDPDLPATLAGLRATVRTGAFVFVSVGDGVAPPAQATVVEDEGTTHVVERAVADERGWDYDFVAGWITLATTTQLHLVGLTATVSTALAARGIACNVLSGRHHDHLLVPLDRVDDALLVLTRLREGAVPAT